MALRDDIVSVMRNDGTLMAVLTGGVHTGLEISRSHTPAAFDTNKELMPTALVQVRGDREEYPYVTGAQTTVEIYFYQRHGFDSIDPALERTYQLLHYNKVGPASSRVFQVLWADDVRDQKDEALDANVSLSRYEVHRLRGAPTY
jgi:hypothetical protein